MGPTPQHHINGAYLRSLSWDMETGGSWGLLASQYSTGSMLSERLLIIK